MGYRRDKTYRLVFDDPEFDGLEVVTLPVGIGRYLRMKTLIGQDLDEPTLKELFSEFEELLHSWNYEDDNGEPVPTGPGCMWNLDLDFAKSIIRAWNAAMTTVAAATDDQESADPLPEGSSDGGPFPEGSIPMEIPSESRAS